MEPVKWLTSALGATAAIKQTHATESAARDDVPDVFDWNTWLEMMPPQPIPAAQMHDFMRQPVRRDASHLLQTRFNKCVDVKDGRFSNGNSVQIWDCDGNSKNQQWTYSGGQIHNNGFCLDVKDGAFHFGAPLQIWQCVNGNRNQMFVKTSVGFQVANSGYSLDVKDGHFDNGGSIQLWGTDNNANGNQVFKLGSVTHTTTQSPSSFLGYATISWDRFAQLHHECAPYGDAFKAAAAGNNLVPTLLAAVAETESSCNPRVNRWGLMQFSDDGAWNEFGGRDKDRTNPTDAIWAGARYLRRLINDANQNLDAALRAYNGPISQGGNVNYIREIKSWMSGGNPWSEGI